MTLGLYLSVVQIGDTGNGTLIIRNYGFIPASPTRMLKIMRDNKVRSSALLSNLIPFGSVDFAKVDAVYNGAVKKGECLRYQGIEAVEVVGRRE